MRLRGLDLISRGCESATIVSAGHIVLVGEPGAGRPDLIEALDRATCIKGSRDQRLHRSALLLELGVIMR